MSPSLSLTIVLVGLGLFAVVAPLQAQNQPVATNPYGQVSIASPTAASLGKYADVPVNYHTGVPAVSVPLYTVTTGALTLPISLSYHAGGVKVQEPAGWVGTGWALNAGGVITRSVVDKPDERGTTNASRGHFSDYGYCSYWTKGGADIYTASGAAAPYDYAFANGQYDGEPDLYFFNFNGYTGKFFFSDDRTPVVVDGQDLKIDYYYPSGNYAAGTAASFNIQGFIVTVPTGDKYYFGITDASVSTGTPPVETTHSSTEDNTVTDNVYSSYYLAKMVAADGVHAITFTYAPEQYSYYTVSQGPILGGIPVPLGTYRHEYSLVKNNIDGVRLAQISFPNGTVALQPSAAPRTDLGQYLTGGLLDDPVNVAVAALGGISVTADGFCKQYVFSYGYFTDATSALAAGLQSNGGITTDTRRLRLESVAEKSCDGTVSTNPWVFAYNGDFLPRRLSFAQDHWGFYNGRNGNNTLNTLLPTYTSAVNSTVVTFPGANRDADAGATALGVLTQITYPTGGSAVFTYEPNDVWVNYTTYAYQYVVSASAGSYRGPAAQTLSINFSGNPYRFRLTYESNPNDTYNGSGGFSGPYVGLNVDEATRKLSDEVVVQPSPGSRSYSFTANTAYTGTGEAAVIQVDEYAPRSVQANVLAGGLRIHTVTAKESVMAAGTATTYTYHDANSDRSTGTLYSRPRYVQVIRNDNAAKFGFLTFAADPFRSVNGCLNLQNTAQTYLASPCGVMPLSTTQGSHLGYDRVTVSQAGKGKTDYYYYGGPVNKSTDDVCYRTVSPGVCDPSVPSLPAVPPPYDYSRGQLKYERTFDEAGQLVKDLQYTYAYDSSKTATPAYLVKYVGGALLGSNYQRRAYWKTRMQIIETNLSAGLGVQTKKIYAYASPYHHQLTRMSEVRSASDSSETKTKYAFDFRVPAVEALADGNVAYAAGCAACDAALRQQLASCTDEACAHRFSLDNALCRANVRKDYIAYRLSNFTAPTNAFQSAHDAAKRGADGHLQPLLQLQDDYTNALVETSHWRNGRLLSAAYTTFGPGLAQPTTMYPAQEFALSLASPAAAFAPAAVNGPGIALDPRYATAPETSLTFDQGNLVEVRPKTGIITAYVWGYRNALPVAQATGTTYAALRAAYRTAGGDLMALRNAPLLARAMLTTYAYRPLVGLTAQTDPMGRTVTYEYDSLGRLMRTRDEQGRILSQQQYHYAGK